MGEGYNREEEYFQKKNQELLAAIIHQTVWVIHWWGRFDDDELHTVVEKIEGAWFHQPTEEEQKDFMYNKFPGEKDAVESGELPYLEWECLEFKVKERIGE